MTRQSNNPLRLWDYVFQYTSDVITLTAADIFTLEDRIPFEVVHYYTLDISEYLFFLWYSWIWFHDPLAEDHQVLGRFCGPAHDTSQGLAYHILNDNRVMVTKSTTKLVSQDNSKVP